MKDGAILANTGHFNVEIEIPALRELADGEARGARVRRGVHARGRPPASTARRRPARQPRGGGGASGLGDGHAFANQALCVEYACRTRQLERRVYPVPARSTPRSRASSSRRWASNRHAHGGAGAVPRLVGQGDVAFERGSTARRVSTRGRPARRALVRLAFAFGTESAHSRAPASRYLQGPPWVGGGLGCTKMRGESAPEQIVRLEAWPRRPPRPAPPPGGGDRIECRTADEPWRRRSGPSPSAAHPRSASPQRTATRSPREHGEDLDEAARVLPASRPTAVNLAWALGRMHADPDAGASPRAPRRGGGALPCDGRSRRFPLCPRLARPHALQRRRARDGGLRNGARAIRAAAERGLACTSSPTRRGRCSRAAA